jgi:hypothetical protein
VIASHGREYSTGSVMEVRRKLSTAVFFGVPDKTRYSNDLKMYPVVSDKYWKYLLIR